MEEAVTLALKLHEYVVAMDDKDADLVSQTLVSEFGGLSRYMKRNFEQIIDAWGKADDVGPCELAGGMPDTFSAEYTHKAVSCAELQHGFPRTVRLLTVRSAGPESSILARSAFCTPQCTTRLESFPALAILRIRDGEDTGMYELAIDE